MHKRSCPLLPPLRRWLELCALTSLQLPIPARTSPRPLPEVLRREPALQLVAEVCRVGALEDSCKKCMGCGEVVGSTCHTEAHRREQILIIKGVHSDTHHWHAYIEHTSLSHSHNRLFK